MFSNSGILSTCRIRTYCDKPPVDVPLQDVYPQGCLIRSCFDPGEVLVPLLHYRENMNYEEIARILGTSKRTVETRLYRARRAVRDLWMRSMSLEMGTSGESVCRWQDEAPRLTASPHLFHKVMRSVVPHPYGRSALERSLAGVHCTGTLVLQLL